jgi:hypothetical protein
MKALDKLSRRAAAGDPGRKQGRREREMLKHVVLQSQNVEFTRSDQPSSTGNQWVGGSQFRRD